MTWQEGCEKLRSMKVTGVCAAMVQGDVLTMMFDAQAAEMDALRKKNVALWQDMGGKGWKKVAEGLAATELDCGIRHIKDLRQVAGVYTPDQVPRDPSDDNAWEGHWSWLIAACRFANPWHAIQFGKEHGFSFYDYKHAEQVGEGYVVKDAPVKERVHVNTKGHVVCPKCSHVFTVDSVSE
jgi:hypothetical protein